MSTPSLSTSPMLSLTETRDDEPKVTEKSTSSTEELTKTQIQAAAQAIFVNFVSDTLEREMDNVKTFLCLSLTTNPRDPGREFCDKWLVDFYCNAEKEHVAIHNVISDLIKEKLHPKFPRFYRNLVFQDALDLTAKLISIEGLDNVKNMVGALSSAYLQDLVNKDALCQACAKCS